jgi:ribosomal protein S18 acetylase RimI-like enzyme
MSCYIETSTPPALEPLVVERFLDSWRPYFSHAPETAWRALALARAHAVLGNAHAHPLRAAEGLACWTFLPWDTEQFGFSAGRLDFLLGPDPGALLDAVLHSVRDHSVRHLIARMPAADLAGIRALTGAGFDYLDGIQTFALTSPVTQPPSPMTRLYRSADLGQVLHIARTSYIYDRFHLDSALSPEIAGRVHEAWVRNCCLRRAADAVHVAAAGDDILGFVTTKLDSEAARHLGFALGTIVMVATGDRARRRGAARAVTCASARWLASRGASIIDVGTQIANVPAARLYESCGFRQTGCNLTFRKVL